MQPHDPRAELERRRGARAAVRLVRAPASTLNDDGSVASRQEADVTLPRAELDRLWAPEHLERLARTYWRFLTRISLGLLRVLYTESSREIVLLGRPLRLLTFQAPEYEMTADFGQVTWRISRGLLVARGGRDRGYLRIAVRRLPGGAVDDRRATVRVSAEVANFHPMLQGSGWFSRIGRFVYRLTQLRIHVLVTNAFLRSLARLDLAPSVVGALRPRQEGEAPPRPERISQSARR